jgi:hypothetical protein
MIRMPAARAISTIFCRRSTLAHSTHRNTLSASSPRQLRGCAASSDRHP